MVVQEPTISIYFSAIDVDSVPHFLTMRFLIHDANSASKCGRDDAGVAPAHGLSLRHLLVLKSTAKLKTENPITSRAGKISIARTNFFLLVFWDVDMSHAYIVEIAIFACVVRLDCLIWIYNDALLFSLSVNAECGDDRVSLSVMTPVLLTSMSCSYYIIIRRRD